VHLSALRGQKRVVLVFYPGDYTPVCTAQLCSFRDNWEALQAENTVVYGVNPANQEKHSGFATQNRLPFPLLVDANGAIAGSYGCRALFGIVKRTVYIIDRQGRVVWAKRGNPPPSEVLKALHDLKD
jgi:peroxiredoxin Q/BCP